MRFHTLVAALAIAASANAAVLCKADKDCASPCAVGTCVRNTCSFDPAPRRGILCRPAAGLCDKAEFCDGVNVDCPADGFLSANTVCRPVANDCDVSDTCTGTSKDCPSDSSAPAGTACENVSACISGGTCAGPVCLGGTPELTFTPDPAEFPPGVREIDILVKHTGSSAPIEISGARIDSAGAFVITAAQALPAPLASGEQVHLTVRLDPNVTPGDHAASLLLQATSCADQPLHLHAVVTDPGPGSPDAGTPAPDAGSPAPDAGSGPVGSSGSSSTESGKGGGCSSGPAPVEALALVALAAAGIRRRRPTS